MVDLGGDKNARVIAQSVGVVAVLDEVDVDSGTAEIGYATSPAGAMLNAKSRMNDYAR